MKKKILYVSAALFLVLSDISVYAEEQPDVKELFETKCSTCHNTDRPKNKRKTAVEWTSTVMRMKNVNGSPIRDDEAKLIIDYLTKNNGPLS